MIYYSNPFKHVSLTLIWVWLFLFALLPFGLIIIVSLLHTSKTQLFQLPFTLYHYQQLTHTIYFHIFKKSFLIAGYCTMICLLLGYPVAYLIARMNSYWKTTLIMLIIIPFWTSSLIRSYALIAIIKANGLFNTLLLRLGIIHQPYSILFSNTAILLGLVYNLLPFMILPIMTSVEHLDIRLLDAARDLGANHLTTFKRVILPITLPGIIAGSILVFLPAMTVFYIPDILGGAKFMLLGNLIQNQFLIADNWPMGSAISVLLTLILVILVSLYWRVARRNKKKQDWFSQ